MGPALQEVPDEVCGSNNGMKRDHRALGEGEWLEHGGKVVRCQHPSGRISVTYVSPKGYKFRSWKQCVNYFEERSGSPLPEGKILHSCSKKAFKETPNWVPRHLPERTNRMEASGRDETSSMGTQMPNERDSSSQVEVEAKLKPPPTRSVGVRVTKTNHLVVDRPAPVFPDTSAGRRQTLRDSPGGRLVSPSTFTSANIPGRIALKAEPTSPSRRLILHFSDCSSEDDTKVPVPKSTQSCRKKSEIYAVNPEARKRALTEAGRKQIEELRKLSTVSASVSEAKNRQEENGVNLFSNDSTTPTPPETDYVKLPQSCNANRKWAGSEVLDNSMRSKVEDLDNRRGPQFKEVENGMGLKEGPKRALDKSIADPAVVQEKNKSQEPNSDDFLSHSDGIEDVHFRGPSLRPKRAGAATTFKEKKFRLDQPTTGVNVQDERSVDGEEVAIVLSAQPGEEQPPQRRLLDFIVHDENGTHLPIERLEISTLYITGLVLPNTGLVEKKRGFRCNSFGPLTSWSIMGYEKSAPVLVFCTDLAEYYTVKPAAVYKKLFNILFEKAKVCVEVYRSLSKPEGGDPRLHLDEMIARVSRSFSKQGSAGVFFNREFCLNIGKFIVAQLTALDELAGEKEQLFNGLPAVISLEHEGKKRNFNTIIPWPTLSESLKIKGGGTCANDGASAETNIMSDVMQADEKLAQFLQEEVAKTCSKPVRRAPSMKGKYYIKINETEIAADYPLPAYYKAEEEEMDEYIFFDEESEVDPENLPHRKLHNWTLYNSDARLVSLELLPMLCGAETDTEIFGSGVITEDDGSGFYLDSGSGDGGSCVEVTNGHETEQGIRVYLSAVKEWKIEFGASMLFISIRTDGAWYRLGKPSQQYSYWYQPVLKTARLAVLIITMLNDELRVNRLSLNDVIRKLADQHKESPTYISGKVADVERYVIVHGQIIQQQFSEFPDERIKRSAFITGLSKKMEERSHTKLNLSRKKVLVKKGRNLNPHANVCPDSNKRKPMRATTTRLVDRLWCTYYAGNGGGLEAVNGIAGNELEVRDEDPSEESDDEDMAIETNIFSKDTVKKKCNYWKASGGQVQWVGKSGSKTINNEPVYQMAIAHDTEFEAGKAVLVDLYERSDQLDWVPNIVLIEYLYETQRDGPMLHGRVLQRASETILGNAANDREVFLTDACEDIEIEKVKGLVTVEMRKRNWGYAFRKENAEKDATDRESALDKDMIGKSKEYFCRSWYSPDRGAFFTLPLKGLALGMGTCMACERRQETAEKLDVQILAKDQGFRFQGIEYRINDYLYLDPDTFERTSDYPAQKVLFKGGRNKGLRAYAVCQLLTVLAPLSSNSKKASRLMKIRRFYRPEDVDKLKAYKSDICEVYYSEETSIVDIATVRGKCVVQRQVHEFAASEKHKFDHVFYCSCIHDPKSGTVKQLPPSIRLSLGCTLEAAAGKSQADEITAKAKGKGKAVENEPVADSASHSSLATLDIFAGCGGLSEGLRQSGAITTKWAIEYDYPAAEAFKLNHPSADVFCDNCNVILRSIMEIGGDLDDCVSTPEADDLSFKLDGESKSKLPKPGEVDFISGGPPCQGFSGMNRFSQRAWSKVQCEMILSFLSYAEYFRPRYFLLENVRNFVSFNKGQTFRLSLASLLEMGYQVRFGVLQAGNYGVAQSRKRAFIWAASPNEVLPEWPEPLHVFSSSQLGVSLPSGLQYAAVRDAGRGAPLRPTTVRDTIGELPSVENGAQLEKIPYTKPAESWFQAQIRARETHLVDHISKEMNELNMIRCQRIPKEPGADWRSLPEEKVKLSTGQIVDLIPWCLPNTAERHNQWKGLFGRLDWDGNFPTSITDPQPMGKVGMCFHPEQDRIVTVRECARSQGFPDGYKFYGTINSKHRQIGNAVPPPLARALGHMLKEAVDGRKT